MKVYTKEETAKILRISFPTLEKLVKNKEILPLRIGPKRIFFTQKEIERFLEQNTK